MGNLQTEEKKKKPIWKKCWFWVLLVIVVVGIGSCNGSKENSDGGKKVTGKAEQTEQTETIGEQQTEEIGTVSENKTDDVSTDTGVSIAEQVLAEQDGVKVTAVGFDSGMFGPELKVKIENSRDSSVMVQARDVSVNGIMLAGTMFSCDVAAGKQANDEITFMSSELKAAGIKTFGEIELKITVLDGDTWEEVFTTETLTIQTSAYGTFEQTYDDSGYTALEQDGYKIVIKKLESEDSFWGADIYIYIENNSQNNITVQAEDVSIDNIMVESAFSCDVLAGKKAFTTLTLFESDLTDNGITDITNMELKFNVLDSKNYSTLLQTDVVAVEFQ